MWFVHEMEISLGTFFHLVPLCKCLFFVFFKLLPIDPFSITSFKTLRCHQNVLRLLFLYFMLHLIGISVRNVKKNQKKLTL